MELSNDKMEWDDELVWAQTREREMDKDFLNSSDIFDSVIYEEDINQSIIEELHQSEIEMRKLEEDVTIISDIFGMLGKLVYRQGEAIQVVHNQVTNTENNTDQSVVNLEKAAEYAKDKFVIARDIAIVVGGSVLGLGGFFLGPFVGIGTVVAGASAGGAAVAGIHKSQKTKKSK